MVDAKVMKFLEFVDRLPITKKQKIEFVELQIKMAKERVENKEYFSQKVLPGLLPDLSASYIC